MSSPLTYCRPDNCDGSYEQFCDPSRELTNITAVMAAASPCTLKYMKKYWKDYQGDDEDFWEHEWNKHGTCLSTLEPKCYPNYKPSMEAVDYFEKAVELFKQLPSYKWLEEAGIVPSTTATYTRDAINDIKSRAFAKRNRQVLEVFHSVDVWDMGKYQKVVPGATDGSYDPKRLQQEYVWRVPPCSSNQVAGVLKICKGMPVMLKHNEATEVCATNGA